ncbi:hypothetical protein U1Q18_049726, partial [Sarracenia purpurea var. burkii]
MLYERLAIYTKENHYYVYARSSKETSPKAKQTRIPTCVCANETQHFERAKTT